MHDGFLQKRIAIDGRGRDGDQFSVSCQGQWYLDTRFAQSPDGLPQLRQGEHPFFIHLDYLIPVFDAGFFGGRARGDETDDELPLGFHRVHAQPRSWRRFGFALLDQVIQDGFEQIDGHKHIALHDLAL